MSSASHEKLRGPVLDCCFTPVSLMRFRGTIIIKSLYPLWSIGHPRRASRHCDLQLTPWPRSMIFLCFLSHPLLSFATFSSAYLSFHIPEDFNLMQFSLLLLFLYVTYVNPIPFSFLFSIDFWWVTLHSSSFVILSVHFIFIIRLKHLFTNICSLLAIWLVVFQVSQAYNNTDFTHVLIRGTMFRWKSSSIGYRHLKGPW
jgi:hypothetical protein